MYICVFGACVKRFLFFFFTRSKVCGTYMYIYIHIYIFHVEFDLSIFVARFLRTIVGAIVPAIDRG